MAESWARKIKFSFTFSFHLTDEHHRLRSSLHVFRSVLVNLEKEAVISEVLFLKINLYYRILPCFSKKKKKI